MINTTINNIKAQGLRGVLDNVVSNFPLLNWCKVSSTNRSKESLVGTKNPDRNHACNLVSRHATVCFLIFILADHTEEQTQANSTLHMFLRKERYRGPRKSPKTEFLPRIQFFCSALTVPLQCPYSAPTVPFMKTHSALTFLL